MSLFKRKEGSLPTPPPPPPQQAGLSEKATEGAKAAVMQAKRKRKKLYRAGEGQYVILPALNLSLSLF